MMTGYRRVRFWDIVTRNGMEMKRPLPFYRVHTRSLGAYGWEPASPDHKLGDGQASGKSYLQEYHDERIWNAGEAASTACKRDSTIKTLHDYTDCTYPYA